VQTALTVRGYDTGGIDGLLGERTRSSLRSFQTSGGLRVTGYLDLETLDALGITTADPSLGVGPAAVQSPPGTTLPPAPAIGAAPQPVQAVVAARPAAPEWLDRPTAADLERLRPSPAGGRAGLATVRCRVQDDGTLTECVSISEAPLGSRYGQAAVRASALYRMRIDGAFSGFISQQIEVSVAWPAR
jgi:peptidoglycan hydrolase-like protein with peptidoglycan-binding domain